MADPLVEEPAEMLLVERNQEIEALASHGSDQPFAKRIRSR